MKQHEMIRMLLHKAGQDQAVLETLLNDPRFDDETLGFHAQQAAEKLLKAWLVFQGVDYPKVHRIETLLEFTHEEALGAN
ncbi:MAG: HEPN domain-containing protein [Candidatus Hydrogenedentes bacterium]|nr:HEPN domain-containing protein [Candidatus Hydrogenedentota bacterium]